MINRVLDIIYPQKCLICGRQEAKVLCNKCDKLLDKNLILNIKDYHLNKEKYFDEHLYLYEYESIIRKLLLKYKFQEEPYLYKIFVEKIKNNRKIYLFLKKYDIIIPVPISKKRMKKRGYNQTALISKKLSKEINIKYIDTCLLKNKDTLPQSILNKEERIKNVENVYSVKNQERIIDKKILIIDDIFTTGSTINECSKVLIEAGAKSIGILTIAKD